MKPLHRSVFLVAAMAMFWPHTAHAGPVLDLLRKVGSQQDQATPRVPLSVAVARHAEAQTGCAPSPGHPHCIPPVRRDVLLKPADPKARYDEAYLGSEDGRPVITILGPGYDLDAGYGVVPVSWFSPLDGVCKLFGLGAPLDAGNRGLNKYLALIGKDGRYVGLDHFVEAKRWRSFTWVACGAATQPTRP